MRFWYNSDNTLHLSVELVLQSMLTSSELYYCLNHHD